MKGEATVMYENRSCHRATYRLVAFAMLAVGLVGVAACQTLPVYRPRGPNDSVGYTDKELTHNRYRVTFAGTSGTRREQVEDYLMRRSAEVTLNAGYSYFAFDTRDTKANTRYHSDFALSGGYGFGPRRPWYWSNFGFNEPGFGDDVVPITRYSAYAEIVLLTPDQAKNDPDSISAREVLQNMNAPPGEPPPPPPPRG